MAPAFLTAAVLATALLWIAVVFVLFAPFMADGAQLLPLASMVALFFVNLVVSVT